MKYKRKDKRKVTSKLFEKKDVSPFYIRFMPYFDSNIPSKIFHASIDLEFLRISWATADLVNVVTRTNLSFIKMKKENKEYTRIISSLKYNFRRHLRYFISSQIL